VRRDLTNLDQRLAPLRDSEPEPFTGAALAMLGLEQMRDRLLLELTHAEMGDFQVVLDAGSLAGADVDQVVRTLGPIQRT
jgi:hypothetical protein